MNVAIAIETKRHYVDFWNAILAPKFNKWRLNSTSGAIFL